MVIQTKTGTEEEFKEMLSMSEAEKRYYKDLDKYIAEVQTKQIPFCSACADIAFNKKRKEIEEKIAQKIRDPNIKINPNDLNYKIDLSQFAGKQLFDEAGEHVKYDNQYGTGGRVKVPIKFINLKCKAFGHKLSIESGPVK